VVCLYVLPTKQRHLRLVATYRSLESSLTSVAAVVSLTAGGAENSRGVKSTAVAAKTAGAWKADDVLFSSSRIRSIDRSIICE
jgi:hypothetical protein